MNGLLEFQINLVAALSLFELVLNAAARAVTKTPTLYRVSPILKSLH